MSGLSILVVHLTNLLQCYVYCKLILEHFSPTTLWNKQCFYFSSLSLLLLYDSNQQYITILTEITEIESISSLFICHLRWCDNLYTLSTPKIIFFTRLYCVDTRTGTLGRRLPDHNVFWQQRIHKFFCQWTNEIQGSTMQLLKTSKPLKLT